MAAGVSGGPLFLFALVVLIHVFCSLPTVVHSKCVLFNFGDSNSDTGGLMAGLGLYLGPPAGRQFFHKITGRFCDGQLYIDFICESLKINFLSPYLESSGSNFSNGVNFAVAGAATEPNAIPFTLSTQVLQFLHFKNRTRELRAQGSGSLISEKGFHNAVYSFDMGQNDISIALKSNSIYKNGGRKFWMYNTGPLGCLPQMPALLKKNDSELDAVGCLATLNNAAKEFNAGLLGLCNQISSKYKDATVVYTDMFAIKYDLITNHAKYGFVNPLMACCGYGGPPYNYRFRMTCGEPNVTACPVGSRYISWDGVRYAEAAKHNSF
ncbi:GDSL esterase/lipase [Cocos nucifera]|uniref:GDSL esterase/lipase n=1 Tax=Cocos nucifera TaxID=13894 RepID=A0A8K0N120_COCNU|nr:GDSL esterase/lipase [Cocos nucifera]